ncbi:hypothetical protein PoB_002520800 [Plakobranchus ocellatus]|uniref:Uncharacterized protein n=1 Tax=Plakobranchus ocellatus TaxID=259542 RepID=A0AAV3ZV01_9GAST|nr:hypothetical protein PoB_002520800 [Plakobranchus ocellatus]
MDALLMVKEASGNKEGGGALVAQWTCMYSSAAEMKMAWGVGGKVASEFALRYAGTLLSRVRVPPPAHWPDGGSEA